VKCIAWNFDGSKFEKYYMRIFNQLRFENGDIVPNMESYFISNDTNEIFNYQI
jgi:hypothetical protein